MAISAYVGVPGSGKSFEVVRSVIIPAVAQGRRVVSNIYGLNAEKIYDYVRDNYKNAEIGEVLLVTNEQVQDENFFPYKNSDLDGVKTYCQPGDLICVDEAWRIKHLYDNQLILYEILSFNIVQCFAAHGTIELSKSFCYMISV